MKQLLYYRDIGSGTPIVLVHGDFNDGLTAWSRQIDSLADSHRLIVVDRRGNGRSPREPMPYTIHDDAVDILELIDDIGIQHYHLLGHSYGGIVAIEMARLKPDAILSLHLIEPPYMAVIGSNLKTAGLNVAGEVMTKQDMADLSDEEITEAFFKMIAGEQGLERIKASSGWPLLVREARRFVNAESPVDFPVEAVEQLELEAPVQVYTGGRSSPSLQEVARRIAEIIPDATLIEIPEANHGVQLTGEPFNRALLSITQPGTSKNLPSSTID